MKLAVDMLGLWMISWFLSECYGASVVTQYLQWVNALGTMPSSVMKFLIQTPSLDASAAAMYSASTVDPAMTLCLQLLQLTAPPFKIYTYPV